MQVMNIQENIITVLENYLLAKTIFKQASKDAIHYEALSSQIPKYFRNLINKYSENSDNYIIKYSQGMGNWAEIPWIVFMNRNVTLSAQEGYYLVLGFSADMKSVYLSLNQGVSKTDKNNLSQFAHVAIQYTKPSIDENVIFGKIDFNAKNKLGKDYGKSAIKSYRYTLNELKSLSLTNQIDQQFKELLKDYENIYNLVGKNILNLHPIKDCSYQEELQKLDNVEEINDTKFIDSLPKPNKGLKYLKYYTRNTKFSKNALKNAGYKCEINPEHITFNNGKHQYMEGHHLIPMSFQDEFEISLDVPANIVSVCPTCHKALHYGNTLIKKQYIEVIFKNRKKDLEKYGIRIEKKQLEKIYTLNQLDHEYD